MKEMKMSELINKIAIITKIYEESSIIDKIKIYIKIRKDKEIK